jgi:hypothetical protein
MKELMSGLLFEKLDDIELLRPLSTIEKREYKDTSDFAKIVQIVNQYQNKYKKDLK